MPPDELKPCASKAYEATLGTRHPWLVRKAVGVRPPSLVCVCVCCFVRVHLRLFVTECVCVKDLLVTAVCV